MSTSKQWWKEKVIYQIYPKSFNDTTGNGIGDLKGIIEKLDYFVWLGVDVLWLCPVYQSPMDDNGYDISDYLSIHPDAGTMEDFDILLSEAHNRGLKIIMDLVVNHTSSEHHWFKEAKKSKDNKYREYYIWRDGKNGGPPNDWRAFFGGSAWSYDEKTDQYFLQLFTKTQPDLNWENPKVRKEVQSLTKFWLDKGIDGFRMDVISLISKELTFSDTPYKEFNKTVEYVYANGPKVHDYLKELTGEVFSKYDIMTIGEGAGITPRVGLQYVDEREKELNMIFHLDHMFLGHGPKGKFDPVNYGWSDIKQLFKDWDSTIGAHGWLSIFLDNHDFPRMVSRFGNDGKYRIESAKMLATLIITHRGTPCIYQGSEIGMTNVAFESIDDYRDVETINYYDITASEGMPSDDYMSLVHEHGRDNARTPFQWSNEKNAGFSDGIPWIKVNPNYKKINIESAKDDQNSILHYYKNLIKFRKDNPTLIYGDWEILNALDEDLYIYSRKDEVFEFLVVLNHSDHMQPFSMDVSSHDLVFYNLENKRLELMPWEARIYRKEKM